MRANATATAGAGVLAVIALVLLGVAAYVGTHLFDGHKTEDAEWLIVLLAVVPLGLGLVCLGAAVAALRAGRNWKTRRSGAFGLSRRGDSNP